MSVTTPFAARSTSLSQSLRHALALSAEITSAILLGPIRFYQNRQVAEALAQMNAHELSDIGLSRQDASDAAALPASTDAGTFLTARIGERRRAR